MNPLHKSKSTVEDELAQHKFEVRGVSAVESAAGQILVQVTTNDGRTAEGTEQMMCQAIWRAHEAGVPLERELEAYNMYS